VSARSLARSFSSARSVDRTTELVISFGCCSAQVPRSAPVGLSAARSLSPPPAVLPSGFPGPRSASRPISFAAPARIRFPLEFLVTAQPGASARFFVQFSVPFSLPISLTRACARFCRSALSCSQFLLQKSTSAVDLQSHLICSEQHLGSSLVILANMFLEPSFSD
jgi:hypothetical protein